MTFRPGLREVQNPVRSRMVAELQAPRPQDAKLMTMTAPSSKNVQKTSFDDHSSWSLSKSLVRRSSRWRQRIENYNLPSATTNWLNTLHREEHMSKNVLINYNVMWKPSSNVLINRNVKKSFGNVLIIGTAKKFLSNVLINKTVKNFPGNALNNGNVKHRRHQNASRQMSNKRFLVNLSGLVLSLSSRHQ